MGGRIDVFSAKTPHFLTLWGSELLLFCTHVSLLSVAPLCIFVAALNYIR